MKSTQKSKLDRLIEGMVKKVLRESISPQETEFLENLKKNKSVLELAKHYGVDVDKVIKELRIRMIVNRDMKKNIKKVRIDYTDTNTGINVKQSMSF